MAGQILLMNPRPRRRKESVAERAKLRAAAKRRPRNSLGEFVSGAKRNPKVRANPRKKVTRRYHHERWTARAHPRAADGEFIRKNPRRMATRRRSEPVGIFGEIWDGVVRPAAVGTAGAMVMELAVGYVPLPEALRSGAGNLAVKALIAVGLGMAAKAAGFEKAGAELAVGALTVAAATQAKDLAAVHMPDLKLGSMGYFSPAMVEQGPGMGMFMTDIPPAPVHAVPARRA